MGLYIMLLPTIFCIIVISNLFSGAQSSFSLTKFNRYSEIMSYVNNMKNKHRNIAKIINVGKSYEGRRIPCIKISSNPKQRTRPMIMVDAGIHAREWIAPAVALRLINELLENPSNSHMIENVDWLIMPLVNPDGYEYTHTTYRLWRKNRSKGKRCLGVDLNRNFGFHWMEKDSSDDECGETYAGSAAFSEPESRNLKNLLTKYKSQIKLYVTMHSYGPLILYPWSYTGSKKPKNFEEHVQLAKILKDAIKQNGGTDYQAGASTEIFSTISGVSDDWAKGVLGIPLIYTIELPPGGDTGFDPPPSDIEPRGTETFAGYKELHKYIENKWGKARMRRKINKKKNFIKINPV